MADSIIDQLKVDERYKHNTIIRSMSGMMIWIQHDEESDAILPTNQEGKIVTPAEFEQVIQGVRKFYDFYGNEAVEEFNAQLEQRRAEKRMEEYTRQKPEKKPTPGYVYLIRAENGLYKIGKAKNIKARMKPFSIEFPMKWELVHSFSVEDYTFAEQVLHTTFNDKRDVGEWFKLTADDVEYIKGFGDMES